MFNNAEGPLKAQSSIQAQGLSTMVGKLKAQRVQSGVRREFEGRGKKTALSAKAGRWNAVTNTSRSARDL